jgi:polyhydroxybutyrate depolymerase
MRRHLLTRRPRHRRLTAARALAAVATFAWLPTTWPMATTSDCGTYQRGLSDVQIRGTGTSREYVVFVPDTCTPGRPWPVVIDLHGSGSHPREQLSITGMAAEAERRGLVILLPVAAAPMPGGGATWNVPPSGSGPDDVQFVSDALEDVAHRMPIDRSRVYVSGFSGGARLASAVASGLPQRIAAAGAIGGLRAPDGSGSPVPIIAWHGTADPINPYDGGGPAYWGTGVESAARAWAVRNRCQLEPASSHPAPGVLRFDYRGCARSSAVVLQRLDASGHVWPGSAFPFPHARFGPTAHGVDTTRALLDFFESHRQPMAAGTRERGSERRPSR